MACHGPTLDAIRDFLGGLRLAQDCFLDLPECYCVPVGGSLLEPQLQAHGLRQWRFQLALVFGPV